MTEPTQGDVVWLTQAKYDELKADSSSCAAPDAPRSSRRSATLVTRAT